MASPLKNSVFSDHIKSARPLYPTILSATLAFQCPAQQTARDSAGKLDLRLAAKSKTLSKMLRLD
ncbi:MAG TPA: hypothetical protein DDW68_12830 [Verrucomicrobiales bacterium]|nr:hypothetical protein [Verrucomicrobiales bacterium]HBE98043.1 hypothetical protein [Verrucomicrobiales bacterium]